MDQQVQLIAARLRWARENLEIAPAVMAEANGMSVEEYLRLERGEEDFSFSFLFLSLSKRKYLALFHLEALLQP